MARRAQSVVLDSKVRLDIKGPNGPVMEVADIFEGKALCSYYHHGYPIYEWYYITSLVLDEDCEAE